ncbi:MAG TPA: C45 family autoproteolytic acyltransferase/hydrolase [Aggregatilineales bacterium]|nr:C45 family autoproteolytic acyltransferase/hydrolase [Aggregatilineales bacterium]
MHEITLRGTPDQMGTQHGALMAQVGLQLPALGPDFDRLADGCERMALEHTPELVEELRAFAEAARIPYETLKTFTLTVPLQQSMPSCSVVAVLPERSANGKLLIGRNYDFAYDVSQEGATVYTTYPAGGHAHIGSSDIWVGREDGVNDAGLFVAISATFIPGVQPGLPFWFIVRHMLEHCDTVEQALAWIQSVPHSQSRNYMLAGGQQAVVVEATINEVRIREPEDGILVKTNHPLHPDLAPQVAFTLEDSLVRYERMRALPDEAVTRADVRAALNDREHGVCAHAVYNGQSFGTIWSVIGYPEERRLAIAPGTGGGAGEMEYRDYTL